MKMTQFKAMLAAYGADVSRWDGADIGEVKELVRTSAEARALFKEAEALDDALDAFTAGAPDPALLDKVMHRIAGPEARPAVKEDTKIVDVPPFMAARTRFYRGGAIACALVVLLVAGWLSGRSPDGPAVVAQNNRAPAQETKIASADIDSFLAELDNAAEEDVAEQEMIGLLAMADTTPNDVPQTGEAPAQAADEDIDAFLDRLFSDTEKDPDLRQEMDTWDMLFDQQL